MAAFSSSLWFKPWFRALFRWAALAGACGLAGLVLSAAHAYNPSEPPPLRKVMSVKDPALVYPTPPVEISPIENVRYRTYSAVKEINTSDPGMHIVIEPIKGRRPALRLAAVNRLGQDLAVIRFQLILDFVDGKELESHASLGPIPKDGSKAIVLALPPGIRMNNIYYYFLRELQLLPASGDDIAINSLTTTVHYQRTRFSQTPPPTHPDRKPHYRVK